VDDPIIVKEYLSEASEELLEIVDDVIANNKKLHIGVPVGTGKTFFAIDVVEHLGTDYKFLFLFPIIAISEQAQVEFDNRNIDAAIFNNKVDIDDVKSSNIVSSSYSDS